MKAAPLVSVVCAAYNRGSAIRSTIDSVLAQTMADFELIVVSDGSMDETDATVRSAPRADDRLRLTKGSTLPVGTTFATMVAGVFSLAAGLSGEYDANSSQPVLTSQPSTISVKVSERAGHQEPMFSTQCAFCSKWI